ncbi:MAG TPA: hypothetical protein VMZ91_02730 [Candidatus Paceibacterota bacterium]|nr:hypothetical protein [Candidatus Paceibacterota bacterium]
MEKYCKYCKKILASWNKSGICSNCQNDNIWKVKYEELKKKFERHKQLCDKVLLDYHNKLKKYEPDLNWDGEPE